MKLCKAWPEACLTNSNGPNGLALVDSTIGPPVGPGTMKPKSIDEKTLSKKTLSKASIDRAVDQAVNDVLKKAFGTDLNEDPVETVGPRGPSDGPSSVVGPEAALTKASTMAKSTVSENNATETIRPVNDSNINNLNTVWIAFGIFVIISVLAFQSLLNRIESMEAWLHGRLSSRP